MLEPQGDVITALQEGVILTLVTFRGARDSRLHVSVWGLPTPNVTVSARRKSRDLKSTARFRRGLKAGRK